MSEEIKEEQIAEWKKKYGKVMRVSISGIKYYYRPIDSDEYINIQKLISEEEVKAELQTAIVGTIFPEINDKSPAGAILVLSDEIIKISGFIPDGEPEEL